MSLLQNKQAAQDTASIKAKTGYKFSLFSYVGASLATIYDAYSSWRIIAIDKIASEGNGIWTVIAETYGFDTAMVIRAIVGVSLLTILFIVSRKSKVYRTRKFARVTLYGAFALLFLLCLWHVYGTVFLL